MPMSTPEAQREYQRQWIAKRRSDYMADKSCAKCGSTEGLEIDHIDPASKVDHKVWSWSAVRREAELLKCQVLCHAHHKEKTLAFDSPRTAHGRGWMYVGHKCRCVECRTWKAADDKARRAR